MAIKIVRFDIYCPKCVHRDVSETDDPCNRCLTQGWNEDSNKPIEYKAKDEEEKKER